MDTAQLLQKLTNLPALSGFERESLFPRFLADLLAKHRPVIDFLGNVIVRIGSGKKRILVEAHYDEVGFLKTKAGFAAIGSIEEREIKKNVIMVDKEGKLAFFKRNFEQKGDLIISPALDNRVGCTALILLMKRLARLNAEVYVSFTVREETTGEGILEVVRKCNPHCVVSVDSAYALPYPNKRWHIPECGKGPALQIQGKGFITNYLFAERIACNADIPYQFEIVDSNEGGTNLSALSGKKLERYQINIPVRYQHTPKSEACVSDIENATRLLAELIQHL